ncbi:hypothetical protein [Halobacteriovorax sp.]|uniref:hypothetical protein n=1 Tax=Halobacteriovorax sp. TaxID=2020862 RepID=UPI003AF24BFF
MKIRESVLKARSYFSKRDKLLSYADFSNFKQQHLELKRNKKSLEFSRSGSYLNSRDKKIYYHEQYVLTATHKIIVILTSPKQISAIERSEVSNRLREIRKETNIGQKSDMLSPLFVDNESKGRGYQWKYQLLECIYFKLCCESLIIREKMTQEALFRHFKSMLFTIFRIINIL